MRNKLVLSKNIIDNLNEYDQWLQQIKTLYRNSQIKASLNVNRELLEFYWQLGHEMFERKIEEVWGSGIVERLSLDIKAAFPSAKGFSTTNLWYIKKWYVFYYQEVKKTPPSWWRIITAFVFCTMEASLRDNNKMQNNRKRIILS